MNDKKALAVFKQGKRIGFVYEEDANDFFASIFNQPEGATLTVVRVNLSQSDQQVLEEKKDG